MYKEHYVCRDRESFYAKDPGTAYERLIPLAGTPEEELDTESPYRLVFARLSEETDEAGAPLLYLEYDVVNGHDYAIRLTMENIRIERKINGAWYACISEGRMSLLLPSTELCPPSEPVRQRILLTRSVYTDESRSVLRWEPLPSGTYRLLQKFDIRYIPMEFEIP